MPDLQFAYPHRDVDDPACLVLPGVRPIRDELERRVRRLLEQLDIPAG